MRVRGRCVAFDFGDVTSLKDADASDCDSAVRRMMERFDSIPVREMVESFDSDAARCEARQ